MSGGRLFGPDGRILVSADPLPVDEPFELRPHDGGVTVVTRVLDHGRTVVVPEELSSARSIFDRVVSCEANAVIFGRMAHELGLLLVKEHGVPEAELDAALDAAVRACLPASYYEHEPAARPDAVSPTADGDPASDS